jgi:hypothetical protein
MDNNNVASEIWPDDMEATTSEEQTEDSPTMFPVEKQEEIVEKQEEPVKEEGLKPEETPTGIIAEPQPEETPAEKTLEITPTETPAEVIKPPAENEELFTGIRTALELPEDVTPEVALENVKNLIEYREQNRKVNKDLSGLLMSEKSYANFTRDLMSGMPLVVALAGNFDLESLKPEPGDEDYSKYQYAVDARKAKALSDDVAISGMRKNQVESENSLRTFAQTEGFDEKQGTEFFGRLETDLVTLQEGKITKEFLEIYKKGLSYDADLKTAKEAATIAARNKKIVAEKVKNIVEAEPPTLQPSGSRAEPVNNDPNDWVSDIANKFR